MNSSRATRYGIEVVLPDAGKIRQRVDCIPRESAARLTLRFPARQRGEHRIETLGLTSCYPLGFVRASREICVQPDLSRLSKAGGKSPATDESLTIRDNRVQQGIGHGDDFAGVRAYVRANPNVTSIGKPWRAGNH